MLIPRNPEMPIAPTVDRVITPIVPMIPLMERMVITMNNPKRKNIAGNISGRQFIRGL